MERRLDDTFRNAALVLVALMITLTTGCGDGLFSNSGGAFRSSLFTHAVESMGGAELEVAGVTGCEVAASNDPEARCESVSDTQLEVFIDGHSIIFDFSNVTKGGKLSEHDFEGYILSVTEDSDMPPILEAIFDAVTSTIDSEDLDVQFDDKNVAVNFRGLAYDDATFVKIDLVFDDAT